MTILWRQIITVEVLGFGSSLIKILDFKLLAFFLSFFTMCVSCGQQDHLLNFVVNTGNSTIHFSFCLHVLWRHVFKTWCYLSVLNCIQKFLLRCRSQFGQLLCLWGCKNALAFLLWRFVVYNITVVTQQVVVKWFAIVERFAVNTLHLWAILYHLLTNSKHGHLFIRRRRQLPINAWKGLSHVELS